MSLRTCSDLSEATSLESCLGLYLKPESKIKINIQLPKVVLPGQSISSWHVMEKIKETIRPDTFLYLKTLKITANVIKLEGELETKASCERALARLRATGSIKVSGFAEKLVVRAAHSASSGPTRHDWEAFFRDAKGVNEMRPGERPDTIYLQEMPLRWFTESSKAQTPSEKMLRKAFGTFGKIRRLEIPKPTESVGSTIGKTSSLQNGLFFEVYIQYEEYVEFSIAMDSLRGKKLLFKDDGKVYSADIKVDFDRTNYLSDKCIRKRIAELKKLNSLNDKTKLQNSTKAKDKKDDIQNSPLVTSEKTSHPKVKPKNVLEVIEEQKKAQLEAKLLLRELLLKAEVSEKEKEQDNIKDRSTKRLQEELATDNVTRAKKIKILEADKRDIEKDIKHLKRKIKKEEKYGKGRKKDHKEKRGGKNHLHHKRQKKKKSHIYSKETIRDHKLLIEKSKGEAPVNNTQHKVEGTCSFSGNKQLCENQMMPVNKESCISSNKVSQENNTTVENVSASSLIVEKNTHLEETETERQVRMALEERRLKEHLIQVYNEHKKNKEKLKEQERILKQKLVRNMKAREGEKIKTREKMRKNLSGRKVQSVVKVNGKR